MSPAAPARPRPCAPLVTRKPGSADNFNADRHTLTSFSEKENKGMLNEIEVPAVENPTPDYWGNITKALHAMAICRIAGQVETVATWLGHHSWLGTVYEDRAIEIRSDHGNRKVFLKMPSFNNARTEVFNVDIRGAGDRTDIAMHRVRPGSWMQYLEHIGHDAEGIRNIFQANVRDEEGSTFLPVEDSALFGQPFAELKVVESEPVNRETSPEFQLAQLIRQIANQGVEEF